MSKGHVHIIGAGVVGLATAASLVQRGYAVTIVDREGPAAGASQGNAAAIAWTDVAPMASPGLWKQAIKWLADPLGPLSIRPAYALAILPWMLRFLAASSRKRVARSTEALVELNGAALPAWENLWRASGTHNQVRRDGCLELFDTDASLSDARSGWAEQRGYGIEVEELTAARLRELEPDLSERVVGGALVPGWIQVDEPKQLCLTIASWLESQGVHFETGEVAQILPRENGCELLLKDGSRTDVECLVIACGAWSRALAGQLGDRIPLDTERGYNITVPEPGVSVKRMIMLPGHGFVMSPLSTGLRVGGAVEFGGLSLPANWKRVDAMVAKARLFYPGLKTEGGKRWMGFRPSLPDSLPVISPASGHANIFYAFGHAHHGLTQSAVTGELIADMIDGTGPLIDPAPFRADRF
ncbi:NAD(P)/FAD-dependent oxidoreductase [Roseibium sediminicola]|uniref:FAD-binding oxidoreductase n=1 Tax=Roseibium sediminicola TaxID=2933272 RepID=A0ABT0GVZ8_9HYPH|nr:FAD-binding oxidoreductase [Roseibium sp. CAU 1639]MCK7613227.1 FAD-binding oxidoreductase [Roseibium sp. CAU 1639]